jgi:DNA-binding response OmpR family regulator
MKHKILLVEDDADLRRALAARLEGQDYEAISAGDGASAIATARTERPSLVLLDLGLPVGDGFTVIERLKRTASGGSTPIVVLSARDGAADRDRAFKLGAAEFFTKPFDNERLLRTIRDLLPAAPASSSATHRPRLLIVEDDPDTRLALQVRLYASGFEVTTAEDAATALTLARRVKPDLITLDLGLPGGDGLQVLERVRNQPGLDSVPVIVLSARDGSVHGPRALAAGAAAYLEKPVDNEKFLAAIRSALRIRAA